MWVVLEGWGIPKVAPHLEFRHKLEEKAARGETGELYRELMEIDPAAAQRIDRRNVRRLIRALEVSKYSEAPFSQLQRKEAPPVRNMTICL